MYGGYQGRSFLNNFVSLKNNFIKKLIFVGTQLILFQTERNHQVFRKDNIMISDFMQYVTCHAKKLRCNWSPIKNQKQNTQMWDAIEFFTSNHIFLRSFLRGTILWIIRRMCSLHGHALKHLKKSQYAQKLFAENWFIPN